MRGAADVHRLVEGNFLVVDEAILPKILLAFLLLLRVVVGDVGGVTTPVVAVVALHHLVVLRLFHHLHLVDAALAVPVRPGGGDLAEADTAGVALALPLVPAGQRLDGGAIGYFLVVTTTTTTTTTTTVTTRKYP